MRRETRIQLIEARYMQIHLDISIEIPREFLSNSIFSIPEQYCRIMPEIRRLYFYPSNNEDNLDYIFGDYPVYDYDYANKNRDIRDVYMTIYCSLSQKFIFDPIRLTTQTLYEYMKSILDNIKMYNYITEDIGFGYNPKERRDIVIPTIKKYFITPNTKLSFSTLVNVGNYDYDLNNPDDINKNKKLISIILDNDKFKMIDYEAEGFDRHNTMIDYIYTFDKWVNYGDDYDSYLKDQLGIDQ